MDALQPSVEGLWRNGRADVPVTDAHRAVFAPFSAPLVEVCGGIGVSLAKLAEWRREFGLD
jgi:hypothetical protein